jgi:hypothetical protein
MITLKVFIVVPGLNYIFSSSLVNVNILTVARGTDIHNRVSSSPGSLEFTYQSSIFSPIGRIVFDPTNPFLDNPREKITVIYKT